MPGYVKVARTSEVTPGQAKMVEVEGKKIALFNVDGSFYAIDDTCTHRGGPLSEGVLEGKRVTCPWHGAIYDVTTGDVLDPNTNSVAATRYNVRVEASNIEVEV